MPRTCWAVGSVLISSLYACTTEVGDDSQTADHSERLVNYKRIDLSFAPCPSGFGFCADYVFPSASELGISGNALSFQAPWGWIGGGAFPDWLVRLSDCMDIEAQRREACGGYFCGEPGPSNPYDAPRVYAFVDLLNPIVHLEVTTPPI